MNSKPFSPEELEQLARLAAMPDEDIDTSDIPVMTDEEYNDPRRPRYRGAQNRPVNVSIDGKVAHWFRDHAAGKPIDAEIKRVLREYVDEQERPAG